MPFGAALAEQHGPPEDVVLGLTEKGQSLLSAPDRAQAAGSGATRLRSERLPGAWDSRRRPGRCAGDVDCPPDKICEHGRCV